MPRPRIQYDIVETQFEINEWPVKNYIVKKRTTEWMNSLGAMGWEIFQIFKNDLVYLKHNHQGQVVVVLPEEATNSDNLIGVRVYLGAYARRYR